MSIKHIKISGEVHEKLLQLKEQTDAKSFSDVILSLMLTSEEFYISKGRLKVDSHDVILKYKQGCLIEIEIR